MVLLDATVLAERAFYAVPARMLTAGGLHTNALFGLCQACRRVLAGKRPSHAVAIVDPPGASRGLPGTAPPNRPPELRVQRPWFEPVLRTHGFAVEHPEEPAAVRIAALAAAALAAGAEVRVVSPDKWLLQLVSAAVRVDDPLKELVWDEAAVVRRFGVPPARLPDLWALVGDEALGAPGVTGLGPKRAQALIEAHGSADGAGEEAATHADALRLPLVDPGPVPWERFAFAEPAPDALNDLYRELGFVQLLAAQAPPAAPAYFVCDAPDLAAAALGEATGATEPVGLQLLVDGPPRHGGIVGVALAIRPGRALYFPLAGPGPALGEAGLRLLAPYLEDRSRPKVVDDAKRAWVALGARGIGLEGVVGDPGLGSFRLDPSDRLPHDLDQVARALLQRAVQSERAMFPGGPGKFSDLPIGRAGAYACHLADVAVTVWPVIARRLGALDQLSAVRDEDLPLARVLARVEARGAPVDPDALAALGRGFRALRVACEGEIGAAAGRPVNPGSARDVGALLFEELGLPVLRRTKTGYKTDADVLERLVDRHPVVPAILRWRTLAQLERTWADGLPPHVDPATGRIHSTVQLTASGTGHLVNADPDLQKVPGRTAEGALVRGCFRADPGWSIVSADWSQLELRLFAHLTRDPVLVEAFATGADVHARTAEALGEPREVGKVVNFATLYGQGAGSLGVILGRPRAEAAAIIARFDATFAVTRAWQQRQLALGIERGVAVTMTGRRRVLHELGAREPAMRAFGERLARNFPVQGTAADLCRRAILGVERALRAEGLRGGVLLAIHDELLLEAPDGELDATIAVVRREMESALDLSVPLVVRVGVGPTWADAAAAR